MNVGLKHNMIRTLHTTVKVKNTAWPVNRLNSADRLNLTRATHINTAMSGVCCLLSGGNIIPPLTSVRTIIPRWIWKEKKNKKRERLRDMCQFEILLPFVCCFGQHTSPPPPPTPPLDSLFPLLCLPFLDIPLNTKQSGYGLTTVRTDCLPLLDLNICPEPEASRGLAGHFRLHFFRIGPKKKKKPQPLLNAKLTLLAAGHIWIEGGNWMLLLGFRFMSFVI